MTLTELPAGRFAKNDINFFDPSGVDHTALGRGLSAALYNYLHGVALDRDVREWFADYPGRIPRPRVAKQFIAQALAQRERSSSRPSRSRTGKIRKGS